jgi:ribonucleoside-diphosphate reductase beta chain
MSDELLLRDNPGRYVVRPIQHPQLWKMYKQAIASFWTAEEIDLAADITQWPTLTGDERHYIKIVLGFFAASDGIVMENLAERFMAEVQLPEAKMFYSFQIAVESIHSDVYSLLIDALIKDPHEKDQLFRAIETVPAVKHKADWALRWIRDEAPFAQRLLAFICVEGIFFSGSFCSVFWLKKRNKMPGLALSNEFISRDEGLHVTFACELYSMLERKLSQEQAEAIFRDAVRVEEEFVCEALPVELIGINSRAMSQYIRYVADRQLAVLGYARVWNAVNPFEWMEMISLEGKTNFFEHPVSSYSRAKAVTGFTLEADF